MGTRSQQGRKGVSKCLSAPALSDWGTDINLSDERLRTAYSALDDKWSSMVRLGASVQELAQETYESIMGFGDKGGHKPPRADMQKMEDVKKLWQRSHQQIVQQSAKDEEEAKKEWADKYMLSNDEESIVREWRTMLMEWGPGEAFDRTVEWASASGILDANEPGEFIGEGEAKKLVGGALKKYEQQNYPALWTAIAQSMNAIRNDHPEAYKLMPRMVQYIKDESKRLLEISGTSSFINDPQQRPFATVPHIVDVVTQAGETLNRLRAENRVPQGMDVNQMSFKELEDWHMEWKQENREADSTGEVVYEFHDGSTIQHLTTPEQLQFEGDEMNHCVGGYTDDSYSIYSLRDAKGKPHVTMMVNKVKGYQESPEEKTIQLHPAHDFPADAKPVPDDFDSSWASTEFAERPRFEVRQIMGGNNNSPKPEYQRKIKEFMDTLRAKSIEIEMASNFSYPYDHEGRDEIEPHYIEQVREHYDYRKQWDEWLEDYKGDQSQYTTGEKGEYAQTYGFQTDNRTKGVSVYGNSVDEFLQQIVYSLVEEYDRYKWRNQWPEQTAQEFFHWFMLYEYDGTKSDHNKMIVEGQLRSAIETAQEQIWNWSNMDEEYIDDEDWLETYEKLHGERPENTDERYGDDPKWEQTREIVRDNHEDAKYGLANKFLHYLTMLLDKSPGALHPSELPAAHVQNMGLPGFQELSDAPWPNTDNTEQSGEIAIPGTLSAWNAKTAGGPIQIVEVDTVPYDEDEFSYNRRPILWIPKERTAYVGSTGVHHGDILAKLGETWIGPSNGQYAPSLENGIFDPWHMEDEDVKPVLKALNANGIQAVLQGEQGDDNWEPKLGASQFDIRQEDHFYPQVPFGERMEDFAAMYQIKPIAFNAYDVDENAIGSTVFFALPEGHALINHTPDDMACVWVEWIWVDDEYRQTPLFLELATRVKQYADSLGLPVKANYRNEKLEGVVNRYMQRAAKTLGWQLVAMGLHGDLPPNLTIEKQTFDHFSIWAAYVDGVEIGGLTVDTEFVEPIIENIEITEEWKRRGIATALIQQAEQDLGKKIEHDWGGQSLEGREWAQKHDPEGLQSYEQDLGVTYAKTAAMNIVKSELQANPAWDRNPVLGDFATNTLYIGAQGRTHRETMDDMALHDKTLCLGVLTFSKGQPVYVEYSGVPEHHDAIFETLKTLEPTIVTQEEWVNGPKPEEDDWAPKMSSWQPALESGKDWWKFLMSPEGRYYTWPVDAAGGPHHLEYMERNKLIPDPEMYDLGDDIEGWQQGGFTWSNEQASSIWGNDRADAFNKDELERAVRNSDAYITKTAEWDPNATGDEYKFFKWLIDEGGNTHVWPTDGDDGMPSHCMKAEQLGTADCVSCAAGAFSVDSAGRAIVQYDVPDDETGQERDFDIQWWYDSHKDALERGSQNGWDWPSKLAAFGRPTVRFDIGNPSENQFDTRWGQRRAWFYDTSTGELVVGVRGTHHPDVYEGLGYDPFAIPDNILQSIKGDIEGDKLFQPYNAQDMKLAPMLVQALKPYLPNLEEYNRFDKEYDVGDWQPKVGSVIQGQTPGRLSSVQFPVIETKGEQMPRDPGWQRKPFIIENGNIYLGAIGYYHVQLEQEFDLQGRMGSRGQIFIGDGERPPDMECWALQFGHETVDVWNSLLPVYPDLTCKQAGLGLHEEEEETDDWAPKLGAQQYQIVMGSIGYGENGSMGEGQRRPFLVDVDGSKIYVGQMGAYHSDVEGEFDLFGGLPRGEIEMYDGDHWRYWLWSLAPGQREALYDPVFQALKQVEPGLVDGAVGNAVMDEAKQDWAPQDWAPQL